MRDTLVKMVRATSWSHFVGGDWMGKHIRENYPPNTVDVDFKTLKEDLVGAMKQSPEKTIKVVSAATALAEKFYEENGAPVVDDFFRISRIPYDERKVTLYSDPLHAFKQVINLFIINQAMRMALREGEISLPPLVREASFMLVEDNPIHAMAAGIIGKAKGLIRYAPKVGAQGDEDSGVYENAERAMEVIDKNIACGGSPPDIILSDIELGKGMDGIQFVRKVYGREKAAGRKPIILMLWSSRPLIYQKEIDELLQAGIVSGSWDKMNVDFKTIVETINTELEKTDSGG